MSDHAARELAVTEFKRTLLVEAGAGTGKTTLLVRRICALIEHDVPTERIAAVTFTVKAAGELKERLRGELKKSGSPKALAALESLDRMTVGTIHGLAAEFLRTLPIEAKLPPEFTPLDELQQEALAREFRLSWLAQSLDRATPQAFELAEQIGLNLLGTSAKSLANLFNVLADAAIDMEHISTTTDDMRTLDEARALLIFQIAELQRCAESCVDQADKLLVGVCAVSAWSAANPAELQSADGIQWLKDFPKPKKNIGSGKNWNVADDLVRARELVEEIAATVTLLSNGITSRICADIVEWIKPAITEFRHTLQKRGAIGFDDQLLLCRDMLRDSRVARDYFKRRFDHVHIDEFQDTDPVQVELLYYLCERTDAHAQQWSDVSLEPGKLFVVGDPKQSIYRFRGADLRIYKDVAKRIEADSGHGEKISIVKNFRSRSAILSEVNEIFAPVMAGQNEYVADYEALQPNDDTPSDARAVELLVPPANYRRSELNVKQSAAREAEAIAAHIAALASTEDEFRYSAAAVLLVKDTHSAALLNAFGAHDIPFVSFMNSAYTSRVEIEAVVTMLHALANPQFTTAIIGALRSPWFGVSDDDLFEHKLAGRTFVYTDPQPQDTRVGAALTSLLEWHKRSRGMNASALLDRLFDEFPIEIIFGLKSEGVQRARNLQALPGVLQNIEAAGAASLADIATRLSEMTKLVQNTELEARDRKRDSVQVMTLHKAKGLEFEYVYLFAFSEKSKSESGWRLHKGVHGEPHQIALSASPKFQTQNLELVHAANADAKRAELQRLLYVGMTRARRKLILPLSWHRRFRTKNDPDIAEELAARYRIDDDNTIDVSQTNATLVVAAPAAPASFTPLAAQLQFSSDVDDTASMRFREWKDKHAARIAALTPELDADSEAGVIEWERVRARRVGSFVHAVLEQIAKGKSLEHAERLASRTISLDSDDLTDAREMIRRARNSALFKTELPAARRVITELPIIEQREKFHAAKFVDLIYEAHDGKWIILDYKTDGFPLESIEQRKSEHRDQLTLYAEMFERATKQKPAELRVYFLRHDLLVTL